MAEHYVETFVAERICNLFIRCFQPNGFNLTEAEMLSGFTSPPTQEITARGLRAMASWESETEYILSQQLHTRIVYLHIGSIRYPMEVFLFLAPMLILFVHGCFWLFVVPRDTCSLYMYSGLQKYSSPW